MMIASLSFTDEPKMLKPVLDFVEESCHLLGIERKKSARLRLAFEEIVRERITKAYRQGGMLTAHIQLTGSYLEVDLQDMGEPYWLGEPEYDPQHISEDAAGLEAFLITHMADEFGSEKLGSRGQRMYLRLELPNEIQLEKPRPEAAEQPLLDDNFSIRRVVADDRDVINAISCLYDEYGYSYGNESIYYPEVFKQLARDNRYLSYLVANEHNEIGGHGALAFDEDLPGMPEFGGLVVKHRFRGHHLSRMLFDYRLAEARRLGLPAVWGEPVAFHTGAQNNFKSGGFSATGVRFNLLNRDMQSPYKQGNERLPVCICVKLLDQSRREALYAPSALIPFIRRIYENLGGPLELRTPEPLSGETQLHTGIQSRLNLAHTVVMKAGADFRQEAAALLRTCAQQRVEMAEVQLSLRDPGAGEAYAILRQLGFFFSGLLPGSEKGCYALLQNLLGEEPNFERPVTMADFTLVLADLRELYEKGL